MSNPPLNELPSSPPGKSGWPWTDESPQLPDTMPDGSLWPRISIVTPSYNRVTMVADAIESVLSQGYPNFEHIVVDGGSTDGTLEILRRYDHLVVISEPDNGMYDALNKGIALAGGELIGFLNTDDVYESNVFSTVARAYRQEPKALVICGGGMVVRDFGGDQYEIIKTYKPDPVRSFTFEFLSQGGVQFNSLFLNRDLIDLVGPFDSRYRITGDKELLMRLALHKPMVICVPEVLYRLRAHKDSLTLSGTNDSRMRMYREQWRVAIVWLGNRDLAADARRYCQNRHARACFQLAKLNVHQHLWHEAARWIGRGFLITPTVMAKYCLAVFIP